ncbi:WD repeat-containing protein 7 isoform X13 [Aplysia californica]|uniref:WD repeat-containing protein 7 isoform X13 n=1 Tax=Aplysia californica TaxID=6500 RepID=A0ABM1VP70_APLCA|nr:WD repeat-containing protein 7 isoform X13 [Aplysia californica]
MATGSSLVVPMVLWGRRAPTHCISTILMTPDGKFIVTGCNDGQICVWDVLEHFQVAPRHMLFGHTAAISCLAVGSEHKERRYVVSSSENGEMCLWDVSDGRCVENTKTDKVHSDIVAFHLKSSKALRLICNGYYDEVVIIDPLNLEIVYSLVARVESDWVSACCVLSPPSRDDDVILAITNSGSVKVWTLSMPESKGNKVPEDESKQIRCLNAQTLKCCPGNLRTVLIVCSKYWQVYSFRSRSRADTQDVIYDASDFTLLCSESNRRGERWTGGDFLSVDRVIVWSNEGRGYLYKLPTKLLKLPSLTKRTWLTKWKVPEGSLAKSLLRGKAVARAKQKLKSRQCLSNPDHKDYHRAYSQTSVHAYYVLDIFTEHGPLDCSPALTYMSCGVGERATHLMLRGDSDGRVTVWALPQVSEKQMTLVRQESFDRLPALSPKSSTTLQDSWKVMSSSPPGILDGICEKADEQRELKDSNTEIFITATIYIPSQGKIVCGRNNGTIVIVPGIDCIKSQLLSGQSSAPSPKILYGHHGRVTCLLYPFNESTRYEPHHLLSGGSDFSVVLWDVNGGVKIHTFTVHGGSLSHMTVPPANCNPRILSCICSVAGDHSVALLSLKERKCLLLASRHLYPVKLIKWRPLDDFMLVQTKDGVVTVWQMETGHLDRVIDGKTAEDVLSNCDENATPVEALTNPSITLAQALKRRNLATFRNLAQQKLQMGGHANQPSPGHKSELVKPTGFPLLIQGIKTNTRDPDAHVLFFDTEALIGTVLSTGATVLEICAIQAWDLSMGFLAKAKEKAETVGQKIQSKMEAVSSSGSSNSAPIQTQPASSRASKRPDYISIQESLSMAIGELFMSCLHAWGLDPQLDDLCVGKLGLHKPRCPISFGLLSHGGHMSLMLPGWHRQQTSHKDVLGAAAASGPSAKLPTLLTQRTGQAPFEVDKLSDHDNDEAAVGGEDKGAPGGQAVKVSSVRPASPANNARRTSSLGSNQQQAYDFSTKINCPQLRWQISSAVTTQHLLSVISVANTLMGMSRAAFLPEMQVPMHRSRKETVSSNHGMVLRETDSPESVTSSEDTSSDAQATIQAQVKQGWSLLAALHCVLLPELVGPTIYQCPQLEMLARRWQDRCLEIREAAQALLLAELRRINPEGRKVLLDKWAPFLPSYVDPELSLLSNMGGHHEAVEEDDDEEDGILAGDIPAHKLSVSFESRRKQATAIVMLGVIGAEFGQEMEPSRTKASEEQKKVKVKGSVEGFSLTNYSLARHTSKALTFLLLQPPSPRLPLHTPIRRAAIDLIGRGFTVWEPYLDVSAVLLGLLELSIDSNKLIPRKGHLVRSKEDYEQLDCTTYGLPLSPAADACRSARHALSLIATARPPAFIITMAKEVARFNALAQNAQSQSAHLQNIILARASAEILHIVELLVEKIPNDVADLIVEAMDVSMFCLDLAALKTKGLPELFPAICRFSMVAYCHQTKRVWVGARNGHLALYEMKQHSRCQMLPAHQGPITAVAVNQDGKYLATFSHMDHKLRFWQTASSSLFGIGSQQTKLVRTHNTPAISVSPISNILKLVRLVWVDKTTVVLLTVDGQELKYSVH